MKNHTKHIVLMWGIVERRNPLTAPDLFFQSISKMGRRIEDMPLIKSNAPAYMKKAIFLIRQRNPHIFSVNCRAHLIHNCSMQIKSYYSSVNSLIPLIKAITVKNKTHQELFKTVGPVPDVIVTRWPGWHSAAIFYSKNLVKIKEIMANISISGILLNNGYDSLYSESLKNDLMDVVENYSCVIEIMDLLKIVVIQSNRLLKN